MNIKEIAKIANVSPSTVSKIINGKDENISHETRERVLSIIKKYNYKPHYSYKKESANFLVALIISNTSNNNKLIYMFEKLLFERGYCLVLFTYDDVNSFNIKIDNIKKMGINGQIIITDSNVKLNVTTTDFDIPSVIFNIDIINENVTDFHYDLYEQLDLSIKHLKDFRHKKIAFIYEKYRPNIETVFETYEKCVSSNKLPFNKNCFFVLEELYKAIHTGVTAVIVENDFVASYCYKYASDNNLVIPKDLSIISLKHNNDMYFSPKLTSLQPTNIHIIINKLISKIEKTKTAEQAFVINADIKFAETVSYPNNDNIENKILVIGSINMDIIKKVEKIVKLDDEVFIKNMEMRPGGKGANQAIGVSNLGKDVVLLGKVGNDTDGHMILENFNNYNIDIENVTVDSSSYTGKAYISVSDTGESTIEIYRGANNEVTTNYIRNTDTIFDKVNYCIMQTEIPINTINLILDLCKEKKVKSILNIATIKNITDLKFKKADIVIISKNTLENIMQNQNLEHIENQAEYFLSLGVKDIIIFDNTDANYNVCSHISSNGTKYYKCKNKNVIDKTGAIDCFVSTFCVFLSENNAVDKCVHSAMYAASLHMMSDGAQTAMPTRYELDKYLLEMEEEYACCCYW